MRSWVVVTLAGCVAAEAPEGDASIVVTTFNTGGGAAKEGSADGAYTPAMGAQGDALYGNGLAWPPAIDAVAAWVEAQVPDVIAFQELFWSDDCATIRQDPDFDPSLDLVCRDWAPGDPRVVERVLGEGYQVACNPGKPDKCVGVRRAFGTWEGCEDTTCVEGLLGFDVEGCGQGARVARGVIVRVDGTTLDVVHVHGSSGFTADDDACRVAQVEQVFVDFGDGRPGVRGDVHVVLGDLNTDPGRFPEIQASAARWNDFVGPDDAFRWITDVGPDTPGSYAGVAGVAIDVDHVASDAFDGACAVHGVTPGTTPVFDAAYFDHRPVRCTLTPRR